MTAKTPTTSSTTSSTPKTSSSSQIAEMLISISTLTARISLLESEMEALKASKTAKTPTAETSKKGPRGKGEQMLCLTEAGKKYATTHRSIDAAILAWLSAPMSRAQLIAKLDEAKTSGSVKTARESKMLVNDIANWGLGLGLLAEPTLAPISEITALDAATAAESAPTAAVG